VLQILKPIIGCDEEDKKKKYKKQINKKVEIKKEETLENHYKFITTPWEKK